MDFSFSDTQRMIAETIKDFGANHIKPFTKDWDEKQEFPVQVFKALGDLGLMGVLVPECYGGSGLGYDEYVTAIDEISQVDSSVALSVAAHNSLCTGHILEFGDEEQKRRWLPKLASAEYIGAWGITEHNTGSDAGGMNTTAYKDGDEWVLNGSKNFITHAKSGDVAVVIVRTGEKSSQRGVSAFVVERGTPGFSSGKKENKLGMRASETAELIFDNCRIPHENLLGEVGSGFVQAMKVLDGGRISIAALSLGISKGAYKAALKYSKDRVQFGKPICEHQAIAFKLADMATEIVASELLIYRAAQMKNEGQRVTRLGAMAKYYSSEVAVKTANEAVQIFGGYGYTKDFPVEKFYRDAKLCTIGEGTSEIQKIIISKSILND
jgi:alkylation response protein AidB-like acyl-CoA dehydrogenase